MAAAKVVAAKAAAVVVVKEAARVLLTIPALAETGQAKRAIHLVVIAETRRHPKAVNSPRRMR